VFNTQKQKQNMEDAEADVLMLDDDDARIPYRIGEVFVHLTGDEVQERLEHDKAQVDAEVDEIGVEVSEIKATLTRLKVELYAKFGKAINLELD
jgi:prefoldin subunit 4